MKVYTVYCNLETFYVTENASKAMVKAKEALEGSVSGEDVWVEEDHLNSFPHKGCIYDVEEFQAKYKLY